MKKGKVYIIGAGPGSPDLITVRGREILSQADVVIYDYLIDKRILDEARPGAELIYCGTVEKKIDSMVLKAARQGKNVARLKSGDVTIFSRLSQELDGLVKEGIEFELVPGVTAANAAAAFTGIPLTDRNISSSVLFVTGRETSTKKYNTTVFYMGVENLAKIVKNQDRPKNTNVAIIENAGHLNQRVLTATLADVVKKAKENNIRPPAIIIIGDVAVFEKKFNWLKKTKKILYTGISTPRYFEKGKTFFYLPLIKIEPLPDYSEFDARLKNINEYDWLIFTSRYGVEYFFRRLNSVGLDARSFAAVKVAAIGNSTKNRLIDFGIVADLVAKDESSKGLINEFKNINIKDKKIFIPRSDLSDKGLESAFKKQGAVVTAAVAYKNVLPKNLPDLNMGIFDEIIFSSPSGVRNFIKRYGKPPKRIKISYIGDVTKKEAKKWNL